ncbi:hypothetical protein PR048_015051 [Dryococelus australis]|uniref:Uncharacterized protein n=1 Tax=Dryococelus australis TaxID=614101 RepID=A0ABQ9HFX7_9NEOP|nr:hypothetical protein PR048_015051 [Dryococelus australis]
MLESDLYTAVDCTLAFGTRFPVFETRAVSQLESVLTLTRHSRSGTLWLTVANLDVCPLQAFGIISLTKKSTWTLRRPPMSEAKPPTIHSPALSLSIPFELLASHLGKPCSIPGGVALGFLHVGIVSDDATGRRVFSGISRFPTPLHSSAVPSSSRSAIIDSQDLVKSHPNLFTHFAHKEKLFGRKIVFVFCILLMSVTGIAQAVSSDYITFQVFVFMNALGTSGVYPLAFIIVLLDRRMKKAMRPMVMTILHKAEEHTTSRGSVVVRLLVSRQGEPGSIPGGVALGVSHARNVAGVAGVRRVFSGHSLFSPLLHSAAAISSPNFHFDRVVGVRYLNRHATAVLSRAPAGTRVAGKLPSPVLRHLFAQFAHVGQGFPSMGRSPRELTICRCCPPPSTAPQTQATIIQVMMGNKMVSDVKNDSPTKVCVWYNDDANNQGHRKGGGHHKKIMKFKFQIDVYLLKLRTTIILNCNVHTGMVCPALLHTHLTSPSSVLKTSMSRAAQISSLTSYRGCYLYCGVNASRRTAKSRYFVDFERRTTVGNVLEYEHSRLRLYREKISQPTALASSLDMFISAAILEWMKCNQDLDLRAFSLLAFHQGDSGSISGRFMWELCRTMTLVDGFSRGSPVSPALSFQHCSILTSITLIGSQDVESMVNAGVELVGKNKREMSGIVLNYFYAVGEAMVGLVALLSKDWVVLQLILSTPPILFILYYWPPRILHANATPMNKLNIFDEPLPLHLAVEEVPINPRDCSTPATL